MSSNFISSSSSSTSDFKNMYSAIGSSYEIGFAHDPGLLSFLAKTLPFLPPNSHILDLGSGTGRPVASTLSKANHRVFGLDFSATMVSLAQTNVPGGSFAIGDMRTFDPLKHWGLEGFDAVFSILSLFILEREEIEAMVGNLQRWVRKGGLVCLCVVAGEDLRERNGGEGEGWGEGWDSDGICVRGVEGRFMGNEVRFTLFGREGWRWLLGRNGFEVLSEVSDVYRPPVEADSDEEPHYYLVARKV